MFTTNRYADFIRPRDGQRTLTANERHKLAMAPLPAIRTFTPTHSAHATGRRHGSDNDHVISDYASTKGDQ